MKPFHTLTVAACVLLCAGCSNDDFTPGPPTADNSPGVYFAAANEALYTFASDEAHPVITLAMGRMDTAGELTVPLEATAGSGLLTLPQSVNFADGQAEASVTVEASGLTSGVKYSFSLAVPAAYTRPYSSEVPGVSSWTAALVTVDPLMAEGLMESFGDKTGGTFPMETMPLSETEYLFRDFLGSGQPLTITVDPSTHDIAVSSPLGEYVPDYYDFAIYEPLYPGGDAASSWLTTTFIYYPGYSYYYDNEAGRGICLSMYVYWADGAEGYENLYIMLPE